MLFIEGTAEGPCAVDHLGLQGIPQMAPSQAVFATAPVRQQQKIVQPQTEWLISADTLAIRTRCCRAQIIYEEGASAECWYRVASRAP